MRRRNTDQTKTSSPKPSKEEEETTTDEDEEWTPLSGDKVIEAAPVCFGARALRKRRVKVNYTEPEVPEDDHFYFCDQCGEFFLKECSKHGPPVFIEDYDKVALPETDRARKTLPRLPSGFEIKRSRIPNAGLGVFYCGDTKLNAGTHFGKYEGVKTPIEEAVKSGYSWVIRRKKGGYDYIDAKDETRSNWMRYVNCARNETEQNLVAFQHRGRVLYRCCRPVARGEELLVWYGDEYAKELGIIFDELWDNKSSAGGVRSEASQTQVFSCSECPFAFTSQLFLHKHIKRSHGDLYGQMVRNGQILTAACQPISSSVTSQKQGDTSKQRPHSQKLFAKTTTQAADVKTGKTTHTCKLCGKSFSGSGHLKRHQVVHTGDKPFSCKQCDKRFSQLNGLKRHKRLHTGEKPFQCQRCDKSFRHLSDLKSHKRLHTGEKPYTCNQCDQGFRHLHSLKRHMFVHTGEKRYACNKCYKSFREWASLKEHLRVHTGEKPYSCKMCDKGFSLLRNLKEHLRIHTGEKPYACKMCDKGFSQLSSLKRHQVVHSGERPFSCKQCDKRFSLLSNLETHKRLHTGEKPYACKLCDKSFSVSHTLKEHLRVHTGEKPFQCDQCDKSFSWSGYLKIHKRLHTGEKPYACKLCDKGFSRLSNLKRHQAIHTGEKPYACKMCDKGFSRLSNLKRHQAIHSGEKP